MPAKTPQTLHPTRDELLRFREGLEDLCGQLRDLRQLGKEMSAVRIWRKTLRRLEKTATTMRDNVGRCLYGIDHGQRLLREAQQRAADDAPVETSEVRQLHVKQGVVTIERQS